MATSITVELGARSYPVVLEEDGFQGIGAALAAVHRGRRVALVTETTVGPLWADALERELKAASVACLRIELPAGERHKTVATWTACVDALLEAGVDRKTPVLALGGGVLGDIAGFAAATTLRGMPFIQVPTTLLAMVDSSVGGKTGVNHPGGKNLIGAFHQPILVFAALSTLTTLAPEERRAGLGEVVKTALLDAALFTSLEANAEALADGEPKALAPVIARCVELKAQVVAQDERESGVRAVLNAGHTVGHALEQVLGYGTLRHGEAVGLGLIAETAWAVRAGVCLEEDLPRRISRLLGRLCLPSASPKADLRRLEAAMRLDKKTDADKLSLPVAVRVGRMQLVELPLHRMGELVSEPE